MQRLRLEKPRSTELALLPLSTALPLVVHWLHRSWICCRDESTCVMCDAVPRRPVVYFAAAYLTPGSKEGPVIGLFERSATWYHEACRQSGTNWSESLGRLRVVETVECRARVVSSTSLYEEAKSIDLVPTERLTYSVAALYQFPRVTRCTTVGDAQRLLRGLSAKQMGLLHPQAT